MCVCVSNLGPRTVSKLKQNQTSHLQGSLALTAKRQTKTFEAPGLFLAVRETDCNTCTKQERHKRPLETAHGQKRSELPIRRMIYTHTPGWSLLKSRIWRLTTASLNSSTLSAPSHRVTPGPWSAGHPLELSQINGPISCSQLRRALAAL